MISYKHLDDVLAWWITGLLYLLPRQLREKIRHSVDYLLVEPGDECLSLTLYQDISNAVLQSMQVNKDDSLALAALQEWLNELGDKDTDIVLVIPENEVLIKSLSLPSSAKDNVREILGFEMDRQTPFSVDQVCFDHLYLDAANNKDKLQIELFVITKKRINNLINNLKYWQIQPQRITIRRKDTLYEQINLLPEQDQSSPPKRINKLTRALSVCCFALFITVLYLPLSSQEQKLAALEIEVNKQRVEAKQLLTLSTEKEAILSRSRFLLDKRNERIVSIEILDELSRILPDDTWLSRLVLRDSELQIQGESYAATAIIQLIETSDYFHNAQFRSPVTHNNATDKDKFNVSAQLLKENAL